MEDEVKEIVNSLLENGKDGVYEAHGEDGGTILNALQSAPYGGPVKKIKYVDLGDFDFIGNSVKNLFSHHIHVFTYYGYKFIVLESIDEEPNVGGTCQYASVQMFINVDF
tara:strand:+ start:729 stop:1058 length:330 start_codon:yes stop_codon:yes gene_type:complete